MSTPARQVRARPASKPRARTTPSRKAPSHRSPSRKAPAKRAPQKPPLRVVRPAAIRKPVAFYVMAVAVVGAMVFALAATNVLLAQGAFRMRALAQEQAQLRQLNGELRLNVAGLITSNRIAQEAKRIGLVFPDVIEVVHKNGSRELTGSSIGSPKPARISTSPRPGGTE